MIAEYERAQIAERCRRGKLHRARAGAVSVLVRAPYGYRYVKQSEHADAFYEIDELEAPIVREIFDRYVERARVDRADRAVAHRAGRADQNRHAALGHRRRSGRCCATPPTPGQAAYGQAARDRRARRSRRARHASAGRLPAASAYEHVGPEHWQRIPVPALITEEQLALAQELLERNSRLSPRNTRRPSLLQGILVCRECGYSYYRSSTRSKNGILHQLLPLLGHRRPPPPRRARLRAPAGPRSTRSTSSSGRRCSRCSRTPS